MKKDAKGLIAASVATLGILWTALAAGKLYSVYGSKKNEKDSTSDKKDQGGK